MMDLLHDCIYRDKIIKIARYCTLTMANDVSEGRKSLANYILEIIRYCIFCILDVLLRNVHIH